MAPGNLLRLLQSPSSFDSSFSLPSLFLLFPFFIIYFIVVLPLLSTFQQVPGSQLLLLALLQGWGWEVLLAPCHRREHGPGLEQPRGSCS